MDTHYITMYNAIEPICDRISFLPQRQPDTYLQPHHCQVKPAVVISAKNLENHAQLIFYILQVLGVHSYVRNYIYTSIHRKVLSWVFYRCYNIPSQPLTSTIYLSIPLHAHPPYNQENPTWDKKYNLWKSTNGCLINTLDKCPSIQAHQIQTIKSFTPQWYICFAITVT